MDPKDFFRGFFGFPSFRHPRSEYPQEEDEGDPQVFRGGPFRIFTNPQEEDEDDPQVFRGGSFRVFTNPLEMESFFSQQFDEMLKQFGFGHGRDNGFGQFGPSGIFGGGHMHPGHPGDAIPILPSREEETGARDFMLKKDDHPGYLRPETVPERKDAEIDNLSPHDLEKLYPSQSHQYPKNEFGGSSNLFSFGQTFSSSSIRLPDGSTEETKVIKDNEGRETTTVAKKNGEECFTVTTIRHPDGREERHESNACPQLKNFSRSIRQMPNHDDSLVDRLFRF